MNRAREWIHCNEAYRRGLTGKGVGVAILDTGVFLHPDLENCVYGFRDFLKKKQQPYDDNGHGTHVAGMIAGSGTASAGRYQGVAPGAQLVCLKVLDQRGNGYVSDVLAGLRWVRQNGSQYGIRIIGWLLYTEGNERRFGAGARCRCGVGCRVCGRGGSGK